jgi:hypothetical protein
MKILAKNGPAYITLHDNFKEDAGEKKLQEVISYLGEYRMKPTESQIFEKVASTPDLRKTVFHDFPVMAKL